MHVTPLLRATGALLVAGLLYGPAALAQTAVVIGTVTDAATNQPIPDVVVTARSPNLQGEQIVVTDATGSYRIPQLPVGLYTLSYEKEAYKPYTRSEIPLRIDRTVRVNVQLIGETAGTVEYVFEGRAPTIDVGSTSTGVSVGEDFIRRIAVNAPGGKAGANRSFEQLAELAPGAQNDQYGVSINGASSPENGYMVDGLSTNDPAFGVNASPLSVEFVEDVNVVSGGYLPEYGRATGGVVTAVTKSGSNEFHGSFFANWTPGALEGTRKPPSSAVSVLQQTNALTNLGDFGATLGGPIVKDKLWFFAGVAPSITRFRATREIRAFRGEWDPVAGELAYEEDEAGIRQTDLLDSSSYNADARTMQFQGKLTYLLNSDHNVSLSVLGTPTSTGGLGKTTVSPFTGAIGNVALGRGVVDSVTTKSNSMAANLRYAGSVMDKRLLLDANAGYFMQTASTLPSDGSALGSNQGIAGRSFYTSFTPRPLTAYESFQNAERCGSTPEEQLARCPQDQYTDGGPGFLSDQDLNRFQGQGKLTYLFNALGQHVVKLGTDVEAIRFKQTKAYSGGTALYEWEEGVWYDFRRYGYQAGPDEANPAATQVADTSSLSVGGYLQDSWSIQNRVTLNIGVRYDVQRMYGGDDRLALNLPNQWSPRLGVIVDPFATGQMKVFASYAKYFEQVPLDMMDRAFPGETRLQTWHACDPFVSEAACKDDANLVPLLDAGAVQGNNPNRYVAGGTNESEPVDPNIKPQGSDELLAGLEYEVLPYARLGASYTRRRMGNVIEDMSRDGGNTYLLGNPGQGIFTDFPKPERNYDAVTAYFTKAFSDGWLAQASYTWSRNEGNYPGLFRPETGQLDPNILSDFDLQELIANRYGLLPTDRTHAIKLFAAREFRFAEAISSSFGVSYRGNSGTPLNYYGAHPDYGQDEAFILQRGSGGRSPWVNTIDGNVGVNYRLSKDNVVTFTMDVFNLFNFQTATLIDQTYTTENVLPVPEEGGVPAGEDALPGDGRPGRVCINDGSGTFDTNPATCELLAADAVNRNWGNPLTFQAPRQFRFGIRYTF